MTKGTKSKNQKRKFFSDFRNHGKVFKKQPKIDGVVGSKALRRRGNYVLLPTDEFETVSCPHGPCLLLGNKEKGEVANRFFTCAIYRHDPLKCAFKAEIDSEGNVTNMEGESSATVLEEKPKWKYNLINRKLKQMERDSEVVWCTECFEIFEKKHKHPAQFVDRSSLRTPTRLLEALESPLGEAQYFFSEEALGVVTRIVSDIDVDSVLCIGAPRLMETLRLEKGGRKLFMLDYDKRYAPFYKSTEFAQYSMLTHHFYDPNSEPKLNAFLENAKSLLIVCDPPFGVFVEPLMKSVEAIKNRFQESSTEDSPQCYGLIVLPMFVGKRAIYFDNKYYMHDYRVTYDNHKIFSKQTKTTVRFFTNIPREKINLEGVSGYKMCEFCEHHVHESNKHCFMCMKCTSKDGSVYRHCDRCMRCFKQSYRHCVKCERCHLPGRCMSKEQLATGGIQKGMEEDDYCDDEEHEEEE